MEIRPSPPANLRGRLFIPAPTSFVSAQDRLVGGERNGKRLIYNYQRIICCPIEYSKNELQ